MLYRWRYGLGCLQLGGNCRATGNGNVAVNDFGKDACAGNTIVQKREQMLNDHL